MASKLALRSIHTQKIHLSHPPQQPPMQKKILKFKRANTSRYYRGWPRTNLQNGHHLRNEKKIRI